MGRELGTRGKQPGVKTTRTLGLVLEEVVDLARGTVVGDNGEALVVHVKDEVLALRTTM